MEGFDDDYYETVRSGIAQLEQQLVSGRRHAHEEQLRERRQSQRASYLDTER